MTIFTQPERHKDSHPSRRGILVKSVAVVSISVLGVEMNLCQAFAQRSAKLDETKVDLGTGDIGILNYAYALEQLEAAFYTMVNEHPYHGISAYEQKVLADIMSHEVAHRDFFKKALGDKAIPDLKVNFTKIKFDDRKSVLTAAKTFEDLGVSAYNGAGHLLQNVEYLAAAGSIVSIEARHAAIIRDILAPYTAAFAGNDTVNSAGLDVERAPKQVLPLAGPFISTPITASRFG